MPARLNSESNHSVEKVVSLSNLLFCFLNWWNICPGTFSKSPNVRSFRSKIQSFDFLFTPSTQANAFNLVKCVYIIFLKQKTLSTLYVCTVPTVCLIFICFMYMCFSNEYLLVLFLGHVISVSGGSCILSDKTTIQSRWFLWHKSRLGCFWHMLPCVN